MTIKSRMKQRIQHMLWLNILPDLITFPLFIIQGAVGSARAQAF